MQKTKALIWLFPENIRRVEKQADSYFWGGRCSGNSRGKTWGLISLAIRALPHDLVMGGIPHTGSQQLIEFCQENTLVIANTFFQQHKRRLYTWMSPDGHYWNQIDYILCSQRWRSSKQTARTRQLTEAQIMDLLLQNSDLNWRQ